jgi:pimeloyl-ACP methyl ester carboxylesterase
MVTPAKIWLLPSGDRRIAYALSGGGPPLVGAAWWVSHLELDWQDERFRRFWEALAEGYTLVRYDHVGVGMSDREGFGVPPTADGEVAPLGRVLDELGLERVVLVGGSSGGCAAISFAAVSGKRSCSAPPALPRGTSALPRARRWPPGCSSSSLSE